MTTAGTLYDETVTRGFGKLLSAQTASNSASIIFLSPLSNAHDSYWIELDCLKPATGGSIVLRMHLSSDNGSTWLGSGNYWYGGWAVYGNRSTSYDVHLDNAQLRQVATTRTDFSVSGWVRMVAAPLSTTNSYKGFFWSGNAVYDNSDYFTTNEMSGGHSYTSLTAPINGIRFTFSTGNIASGSIRMWGLRK